MKFLQSNWCGSLLGGLLYVGTTVATMTSTEFAPARPAAESHHDAQPAGPLWTAQAPELDTLVAELKKEKGAVALREKHLNELDEQLKKQRNEINQATQTVHQLQVEFDRNVVRVREEESANLKKLAKMYAIMSPEGAANILSNMEDDQMVRFLVFMKEGETAPILEAMSKQGELQSKRIAALSERLRMTIYRNSSSKAPPKP